MLFLKPVAGLLFCSNDGLLDWAPFGLSLEKQVHMVRHKAVRKDCNLRDFGCVEEMRSDRAHDRLGHEVGPSQMSANRPEESLPADV